MLSIGYICEAPLLANKKCVQFLRSSFYYQINSKGQRGNCIYNRQWEVNSLYKGWLAVFKGDREKALCKCCDWMDSLNFVIKSWKTPWIKVLSTCTNHVVRKYRYYSVFMPNGYKRLFFLSPWNEIMFTSLNNHTQLQTRSTKQSNVQPNENTWHSLQWSNTKSGFFL